MMGEALTYDEAERRVNGFLHRALVVLATANGLVVFAVIVSWAARNV